MATPFESIYNKFFGKITDDMYLELTKEETEKECLSLLMGTLSNFEFPRFKLYDYDEVLQVHNQDLTQEEINIFAVLMVINWIERQMASCEVTRMKYSGSDFKFTSQAAHLAALLKLSERFTQQNVHLQKLYKRRKLTEDGHVVSNLGSIMERSVTN